MKFYLLFFASFLIFEHFTTGDDWTHNGRNSPSSDYDDDDDDGEHKVNSLKREAKQLQIGVALPWTQTSSLNLSSIPRQYLVPIKDFYYIIKKDYRRPYPPNYKRIDPAIDYVCKVTVGKGVKIVGRLIYDKQQCLIPEQFSAAQNAAQISSISAEGITSIKSGSQWPHFEVLLNPRGFTLAWAALDLRQRGGGEGEAKIGLMPARPVLAEKVPRTRVSSYSPFIAVYKPKETSPGVYYTGVVQEVSESGTLAFYYGLYNVQRLPAYVVSVLAVLNTRMPPPPPSYRHFTG